MHVQWVMVSVFHTPNVAEAQQIASMLRANGIETFIPDDVTSNIAPYHLVHTGGINVQVGDADAEKARGLIKGAKGTGEIKES